MTTPNLADLRRKLDGLRYISLDEATALLDLVDAQAKAIADVLAMADQLAALAPDDDWGNSVTDTVLADAGRQFMRAVGYHAHITPDAPASEANEQED